MIKAVLFDADGVLIKAERFSSHLERDFGIPSSKLLPFFDTVFTDCLVGKRDLKEVIPPYLSEWRWTGDAEELLQYWHTKEHVIDTEMISIVQHLLKKNIPCYLVTNQEKYRTEYMKKQMGFGKLFTGIFSSAYMGVMKPQKEFFEKVIEQVSPIQPSELLFIDDTKEHIEGASKLGINAYYFENIDTFKEILRSYSLL